jgi:hypothetical protein
VNHGCGLEAAPDMRQIGCQITLTDDRHRTPFRLVKVDLGL